MFKFQRAAERLDFLYSRNALNLRFQPTAGVSSEEGPFAIKARDHYELPRRWVIRAVKPAALVSEGRQVEVVSRLQLRNLRSL